jgi:hypothetical protein
MGIQINGQTDNISATDGSLTISGAELPTVTNLNATGIVTASGFVGNLTGTASTATAAATAFGLSGSPTLSGITSVSTTNLTVNGNAYPSDGVVSGVRNRIINGDMRIDQRNNGASINSNAYSVDRWFREIGNDGALTAQRSGEAPVGFTSSLLCTTTTADASLGATQYTIIYQHIEGNNLYDLGFGTANASPVTLSFWVRSSLTGTFGGSFRSGAQVGTTRSYPFTYSISSSNTWEYKTITIPGDTNASGGTWVKDNGRGATVFFSLGTGSTLAGTPGSWASANYLAATGETSVIGTLNATWYITGVQLEAGTVATPFERRSFGQELALCQRYYQVVPAGAIQGANIYWNWTALGSGGQSGYYAYPVPMRATPTGNSTVSVVYYANNTGASITRNVRVNYSASVITYSYLSTDNSSTTLATANEFFLGAANLNISAEL